MENILSLLNLLETRYPTDPYGGRHRVGLPGSRSAPDTLLTLEVFAGKAVFVFNLNSEDARMSHQTLFNSIVKLLPVGLR